MLGFAIRLMSMFGKKMYSIKTHKISIIDPFTTEDRIIDLGGGGEGVIGQLRGTQVTAVDKRQDELDEAKDGPIKVCADAKELPFKDEEFTAATYFYFLMYVPKDDLSKIFKETYRVLKTGSKLYIWDVTIPKKNKNKKLFVVPLKVSFKDITVKTAYGVPWEHRELNKEMLVEIAHKNGFKVESKIETGKTFEIVLVKE